MNKTIKRLETLKSRVEPKLSHMEFDTLSDYVEVGMEVDVASITDKDLNFFIENIKREWWSSDEDNDYSYLDAETIKTSIDDLIRAI